MEISSLAVFVQAASAGSLSGAARRLKLTPMAATRRLATLEANLGVRLIQRTTRSVSLTAEGESFLPYAMAMVEAEEAGRAALSPSRHGATGLLRVTAPAAFGRKVVTPLIPPLLLEHPGLRIDLQLTDSVVDIVHSGIDVAIRIAPLRDSSMIARRLAMNPRVLCAAPAYLARCGAPRVVADLAEHECLALSGVTHWPFAIAGKERLVRVAGRFTASTIEGVRVACIGGAGLALLSEWDVQGDLQSGALVIVRLDDASPQELAISAVYPTSRQVLPKLRVFVDRLQAALRPAQDPHEKRP